MLGVFLHHSPQYHHEAGPFAELKACCLGQADSLWATEVLLFLSPCLMLLTGTCSQASHCTWVPESPTQVSMLAQETLFSSPWDHLLNLSWLFETFPSIDPTFNRSIRINRYYFIVIEIEIIFLIFFA